MALGTVWTLGAELAVSIFCAFIHYDITNAFERWPGIIWPPVTALILFLTIGGTVFWLGMIWECSGARKLSVRSKVLWLILVVLTPNLGALIYYFCVFSRQPVHQISE